MDRTHFRSLEGIRAYAFLLVFAVHYTSSMRAQPNNPSYLRESWFLFGQVAWVAVPIFFVLSGFLITGVLFETRDRERFFRVFYQRRAVRILPLYYLMLVGVAIALAVNHVKATSQHLYYLVYLHNWVVLYEPMYRIGKYIDFGHLWSLAVEEQFYLVWPVVVFLIRSRAKLLTFCYGAIVAAALVRIYWPMTHLGYVYAYESSLTRGDALMLGSAMALHFRGAKRSFRQWIWPAWGVLIVGTGFLIMRALSVGQALPLDYYGLSVLIPVVNLMAAAVVLLAIEPMTLVSRLCSCNWAVRMGGMSYSLYLLHEPFAMWFHDALLPIVMQRLHSEAIPMVLVLSLAFALTFGAALLTYRFIEQPGLRLKSRFRYGPVRSRTVAPQVEEAAVEQISFRATA